MKLTKRQLDKIIQRELNEGFFDLFKSKKTKRAEALAIAATPQTFTQYSNAVASQSKMPTREFKILLDSATFDHVAGPKFAPHIPLVSCPGVNGVSASAGSMTRLGYKMFPSSCLATME